jgi:hypothetical protein
VSERACILSVGYPNKTDAPAERRGFAYPGSVRALVHVRER